ncbi:MAG: hypothetical protein DRP08_04900 [Candidatus Aenigmatarchaeota archaeon]|nr:MAG: hypothetical protein DRP08_04900 [Candidatus Aenigmarchaeota archaeon]
MAAGKYNFTIEQGSTYNGTLTFYTDATQTTPIDFTGYTWRMQLRSTVSSSTVLLELTTENGRIDVTNQDVGIILLKLTAVETEALSFSSAAYDLESISGATVDRKLFGRVTLSKEVTR